MYIITIVLITILIPCVQSARPTIKLTFTPDEKYMPRDQQVDIHCEILNPNERTDSPQLWHVDLKTAKRTLISRSLLTAPSEDSPNIFKQIKNKRYDFVRKNYMRIRRLQMEDSAKYECDCPDCEETITKQARDLYVVKLVEPQWVFDSNTPLHENTKTTIKCITKDFYPYVGHKILRNNQDITKEGKSSLSDTIAFPQNFTWEATITPTADWHNTTLRCIVNEGNTEQQTSKNLDVLFAANFLKCDDRQFVDSKKEQSTIECSYTGNPQPTLHWLRQKDQKSITPDVGITIETKEEQQPGKYKSIVKFDRNKLLSIPLTTTTFTNNQGDTSGENYYQQLLNSGFTVKLTVNGNDKGMRTINIVHDATQARSSLSDGSTKISLSSILFTFLFIIHLIRR
jgi:hypothetical protein